MAAGIVIRMAGGTLWVPAAIFAAGVAAYLLGGTSWRLALVAGAGTLVGWGAMSVDEPRQFEAAPPPTTVCRGTVEDVSDVTSGRRMIVKVADWGRDTADLRPVAPFRVMVWDKSESLPLDEGDIITFSGTYSLPRHDVTLPGDDDMSGWYYSRGVSLRCFVPKDRLHLVGRSGSPYYALRAFAARVADSLYGSRLDHPTASFLVAILTGDDSGIDPTGREEFSTAGAAHVLALSGMHVGCVLAVIGVLLLPLRMMGRRRSCYVITIVAVWLFALATGLSPSVTRAAVMATAVMGAYLAGRAPQSLNVLFGAALVILLASPRSLLAPGFQLSFVAALSIMLLSRPLNPFSWHRRKRLNTLFAPIAVTFAATLGTLGLVAWHFHRLPVYFLPVNLVAVIVMPVMVGGGLLYSGLLGLGIDPAWLAWCLDACHSAFAWVVRQTAALPGASVGPLYFSPWWLVPAYGVIALLCWGIMRRRVLILATAVALGVATSCAFLLGARQQADPSEAYVITTPQTTQVVLRSGSVLTLLTTDNAAGRRDAAAWFAAMHPRYVADNGIDSIRCLPLFTSVITFGTTTLGIADHPGAHLPPSDYLLVTERYRGSRDSLLRRCPADTILLSRAIHHRIRRRYLDAAPASAIDLASRPSFRIPAVRSLKEQIQ